MDEATLTQRWLAKADEDLAMCAIGLEHRPDLAEAICFHAQQAAEKTIKALLVSRDITFRKVHSLVYLIDLVADRVKGVDRLYDLAEELEGYSVEIRYPDAEFLLTKEDADKAYKTALTIKEFIMTQLTPTT